MKVLIVGGAGIVGSATAAYLASQRLADEIVLLDLNRTAAESHAMDLAQSTFMISGAEISAGDWADAAGADVVVVAAGVPAAEATHDICKDILTMRPLIQSIADGVNQYCPKAVVVSMTNPLDAFNYVLWNASGLPAKQFIAMSVNDSLRFHWAVGTYLGISPSRVTGYVIGEHNPTKLPLFSTVTVDGEPKIFTPEEQSRILREMNDWWKHFLSISGTRTAAWTTGTGGGLTISHIGGVERTPICCSCILEDGLSIGYPVYLDKAGVVRPAELTLTREERTAFEEKKLRAKESIAQVLAYLETHP